MTIAPGAPIDVTTLGDAKVVAHDKKASPTQAELAN